MLYSIGLMFALIWIIADIVTAIRSLDKAEEAVDNKDLKGSLKYMGRSILCVLTSGIVFYFSFYKLMQSWGLI